MLCQGVSGGVRLAAMYDTPQLANALCAVAANMPTPLSLTQVRIVFVPVCVGNFALTRMLECEVCASMSFSTSGALCVVLLPQCVLPCE